MLSCLAEHLLGRDWSKQNIFCFVFRSNYNRRLSFHGSLMGHPFHEKRVEFFLQECNVFFPEKNVANATGRKNKISHDFIQV